MVFTFMTWGAPLWAATGVGTMSILWGISLLRAMLGYGTGFALFSRTGLPTFVAALAWRNLSKQVTMTSWPVLALPLTSTALFLAYNGLNINSWYVAYWVMVPLLVAVLPRSARSSLIVRAIITSMAAHSVGSLIVMYSGVSLVLPWIAIMPKVLFERFVSVCALATVGYAVERAAALWSARRA